MSEKIGLLAAMRQESDALLDRVNQQKEIRIGGLRGCFFSISGQSCVLITSGMGVRRARQAAQVLVQEYDPHMLISFGIAGAVEADLDIGDVVLPQAFCKLEHGIPGELTALAPWPALALEAANQELTRLKQHIYLGTAVTTNGSNGSQAQLEGLAHPVLEMETAGIAEIAAKSGIPLLSLRAISDGPRAPLPLDLAEVMDEDANLKMGKMLISIIRNPSIILKSRQMMRNTTLAAKHAALALVAAIGNSAIC